MYFSFREYWGLQKLSPQKQIKLINILKSVKKCWMKIFELAVEKNIIQQSKKITRNSTCGNRGGSMKLLLSIEIFAEIVEKTLRIVNDWNYTTHFVNSSFIHLFFVIKFPFDKLEHVFWIINYMKCIISGYFIFIFSFFYWMAIFPRLEGKMAIWQFSFN